MGTCRPGTAGAPHSCLARDWVDRATAVRAAVPVRAERNPSEVVARHQVLWLAERQACDSLNAGLRTQQEQTPLQHGGHL